jgi:hypothetical protein
MIIRFDPLATRSHNENLSSLASVPNPRPRDTNFATSPRETPSPEAAELRQTTIDPNFVGWATMKV